MTDLPDGWLAEKEANELRRLARGKFVVELGAWHGRSTVVLSEVAAYVISVDRHRGIPDVGEDSLAVYLDNVRELPNVAIVVANFEDFVPMLGGTDLVYIDGNHDQGSVERDTHLALQLHPSVIAWHDFDFPEVQAGARAVVGPIRRVVGSVASVRVR